MIEQYINTVGNVKHVLSLDHFLDETDFPEPQRLGERSPAFKYPEWLIMFIAILSVKLKIKSYIQIQKLLLSIGMLLPRA